MRDVTYFKHIDNSQFITDHTKNIYKKNIIKVRDDIWVNCKTTKRVGKGKCIDYIINHPDVFEEKLNNYIKGNVGRDGDTLSDSTKNAYASAMMSLFHHVPGMKHKKAELFKKWEDIQKRIREPLDEKYLSNKPNKRQEKAYISFPELEKVRDSLPKGSKERLLFAIYTRIPPVRSDYDRVRIYETPEEADRTAAEKENYIVFGKTVNSPRFIVLQEFKTAKTFKMIKTEIPSELQVDIADSLKLEPREYLFIRKNGTPYDKPNSFNDWANQVLKRHTNKYMNINALRHIYITRRDLKLEDKSGIQRKKVADKMGHAVGSQSKYLWHEYLREKKEDKEDKDRAESADSAETAEEDETAEEEEKEKKVKKETKREKR